MKKKNFKVGAQVQIKPALVTDTGLATWAGRTGKILRTIGSSMPSGFVRGLMVTDTREKVWVTPKQVSRVKPEALPDPFKAVANAPDPSKVMADVLDDWVSGAADNHEALGHRDEDCCSTFTPEDIRRMIDDARNEITAAPEQSAPEVDPKTLDEGFYTDGDGDLWIVAGGMVANLISADDVRDGFVRFTDFSAGETIAEMLSYRDSVDRPGWWPLRKVADLPRGAR